MMRIEFMNCSIGIPLSSIEDEIRTLLLGCMKDVGVSPDSIRKIVVTGDTPSDFAVALRSLESDVGRSLVFTDSKLHTAVAKVVPFETQGAVQNVVVFSNWVITGVIEGLRSGTELNSWPENWQLSYYVVHHEFGHCRDYSSRGIGTVTRPRPERFSIEDIAAHYTNVLLSDFAATLHSAFFITQRVHFTEIMAFDNDMKDILMRMRQERLAFLSSGHHLENLAEVVSHGFWVCLVHYSKLLAGELRNIALEPSANSMVASSHKVAFGELATELNDLQTVYPNWCLKQIQSRLFKMCDALCRSHGFRFEIGETQDALWLD
jgi:hypothetical protein